MCGALSCVRTPTEQLLVIRLFDNLCGLNKSVICTCLVDVWSDCRKDSILALDPWTTYLGCGLGFLDVESCIKKCMILQLAGYDSPAHGSRMQNRESVCQSQ